MHSIFWQRRFRATQTLLDQHVTSFQNPKLLHLSSEFDLVNICFGKSTEQSLSSVWKKSYSVSFTYKHIYQNQWEQFPWGLSTKETCYKGGTFADDWKRTKIHPSSVCYLCLHPRYGHSQSGLIFHPFDIVQPTTLGLHRGFCLPHTWIPSSAVSWKNLSPP